MSIKVKYFSLSIVFAIIVLACERDPAVPEPILNNDISFSVPAGWPQPVYNFQNNTLSNDGFALGRKLFYDTRLSADNSTSCGSCHQQFAAFAN